MFPKYHRKLIVFLFFIILSVVILKFERYNIYQDFIYLSDKYYKKSSVISNYYKKFGKAGGGTNNHNSGASSYKNDNKFPEIDINYADIYKLIGLPGIGTKIARRIINYREINGDFCSFDDLMKVKGIGPKKVKNIKKFVKFK